MSRVYSVNGPKSESSYLPENLTLHRKKLSGMGHLSFTHKKMPGSTRSALSCAVLGLFLLPSKLKVCVFLACKYSGRSVCINSDSAPYSHEKKNV